MIDKLVDECTKTVEEVKPAITTLAENENSYKCSSCIMVTVLFWIFFTIDIGGIGAYFVYFYWYLKKIHHMFDFNTHKETTIYWMQFHWTYKWEKLDKLTLRIELVIFTTIKLI